MSVDIAVSMVHNRRMASNAYRTGYIEHVSEEFAQEWIGTGAYDNGPFWHRTSDETEQAIVQVLRIGGSTVTRVYR